MTDDIVQLGLSGERLTLYQALFRRSERIARMYLGAQVALKDSANPEHFVLAAHCVRELIEKVPEIVAVSTPAHAETLGAKVGELEQAYDRAAANTKLKSPKWNGEIDGPVRKLLEKIRQFCEWKKQHMPSRNQEIAETMRALDGPGRVLPADLEKLAVQEWQEMRDYFVNVAHHRTSDPTLEEFDDRLWSLERILLRKLNPSTFADFDAIDAIVEAGERHAD
jgi:hypothetical protein